MKNDLNATYSIYMFSQPKRYFHQLQQREKKHPFPNKYPISIDDYGNRSNDIGIWTRFILHSCIYARRSIHNKHNPSLFLKIEKKINIIHYSNILSIRRPCQIVRMSRKFDCQDGFFKLYKKVFITTLFNVNYI